MRTRLPGCVTVVAALLMAAAPCLGVQIGALEARDDWRLGTLRIEGVSRRHRALVREAMLSEARPWYAPWRDVPGFDPATFETDLERIRARYRQLGYFDASVGADLELPPEGTVLGAVVYVDEGPIVRVSAIDIEDPDVPASVLPMANGDVFREEAYQQGAERIRSWLRERGHARATVTRSARVDRDRHDATVRYVVDRGPACVFGDVQVEVDGQPSIEPGIVFAEMAFVAGEPFRESLVERTRQQLIGLGIFASVRFTEIEAPGDRVDLRVVVVPGPARTVQLGLGWDSEEQGRALASWRHQNFLGGARQLGATARVSFLRQTISVDLLQPHFPTPRSRMRVVALQQREDEDPYTLDRSRLLWRLQWEPRPLLVAQVFYRAEHDGLSNVRSAIKRALPDAVPRNAVQSGFGLGLDWNATDDPLDPTRGGVLLGTVETVGAAGGGTIGFLRLVGEARGYVPITAKTVIAMRGRAGATDPYPGTAEIPIYERFFAGGNDSVRGYGRWRLGRLIDDHPVGGRTLIEGAFEVRQRISTNLSVAAFLDAGQLSQRSWAFPIGHLDFGTGIGVRYRTPIGPIRFDLGFPLDRPRGDAMWQAHVTVGPGF